MRATLHNGRVGKNGIVFSARHNDRNFDVSTAEHIDPNESSGNFYWHCMMLEQPELTFDEVEEEFYKKHFSNHLNAQNQRYMTQRHAERCKTIDDMRRNARTCPEEVILQIGNMSDTVPVEILKNISLEYLEWEQKNFPLLKTLNFALHQDEKGCAHIHQRRVWIGHDKAGFEVVSQTKALQEMNIERPNLNMPKSRYNNPKQSFSLICREKFLEICEEHRIEIESEPREKSKSGLQLIDYQAQQAEDRAQTFHRMSRKLYLQVCEQEQEQNKLNTNIHHLKQRESELKTRCAEVEKALEEAKDFLHRAEVREAFSILNRERERVR